jgi:23S rRNA (adenine2503-C2)-methyltransferase
MVGCLLRCTFCATGRLGFTRALDADEMVGQFLRVRAESPRPVTSAVFMGMGEPLLNYDAVIRAAYILSQPGAGHCRRRSASARPAWPRPSGASPPSATRSSSSSLPPRAEARRFLPERLAGRGTGEASARRGRVSVAWVMIGGVNTGAEDMTTWRGCWRVPLIISLIDVQDPTASAARGGGAQGLPRRARTRPGQPPSRFSGGADRGRLRHARGPARRGEAARTPRRSAAPQPAEPSAELASATPIDST